jgi:Xaa-Pro aminopeptidase
METVHSRDTQKIPDESMARRENTEFVRRKKTFRDLMVREGFQGLFINHLSDVRYLCGFSGSNGAILLFDNKGYFITDFRYHEQSAEEVKGLKVVVYKESLDQTLIKLIGRRSGIKLGFDPGSLSYSEALFLRKRLKNIAGMQPTKEPFAIMRARKSHIEVEIIKKAIKVSQKAFKEALSGNIGNIREKDLAISLDMKARQMGADGQAFETIVAGSTRGAMVHAAPSERKVRGMTILDWGIIYKGYCTDTTRTLAFGKIPTTLRRAYALVLEAQNKAFNKIAPGVKAQEVDRVARELIEKAGLGPYFGHALGHGVGLEVHERPYIGRGSEDELEEGMIFTVEPGIYFPGIGGVRVEDMVLVTSRGAEILTTLPRSIDPSEY